MIFSNIHSAQNNIIDAVGVDIEADISNGLHSFTVVGLGDKSIVEAKERISSAIKNSGFTSPKKKNQKVVISLSPANLKKNGTQFDLGIALAYLKSTNSISFNCEKSLFVGELSLNGELKNVQGIIPILLYAKKNGFKKVFIPYSNLEESTLIFGIKIYGCKSLKDTIDHLEGRKKIKAIINNESVLKSKLKDYENDLTTWNNIIGQEKSKRALEIAAAGRHNLGLYGPPGNGKTSLARSIQSILPKLTYAEMIETTSLHSFLGQNELFFVPPFRNPHHTSSHSSMIGGGLYLRPGEISLAHNGVLFLDEFPEFDQRIINSLRQPIEDGYISLSRMYQKIMLPSKFTLIIAMNYCPCGYYKSNIKKCTCSMSSIQKYQKKISGPIIDRIEMWVEVNNIIFKDFSDNNQSKNKKTNNIEPDLSTIKKKIENVRNIQNNRLEKNHSEPTRGRNFIANFDVTQQALDILNLASEKLKISIRSYKNILCVSRTIADLDGSLKIKEEHVLEALQYRSVF